MKPPHNPYGTSWAFPHGTTDPHGEDEPAGYNEIVERAMQAADRWIKERQAEKRAKEGK